MLSVGLRGKAPRREGGGATALVLCQGGGISLQKIKKMYISDII